jgi:hypothetical protein
MELILSEPTGYLDMGAMIRLEDRCRKAFERGNVVVFERTNRLSSKHIVRKAIDKWVPDNLGDLEAFWTENASTVYVCPSDPQYKVYETTKEELLND